MRWFKHFSDSLEDPFIQELIDKFGPHGYLAWFGILEIISKENGSKLTGKLEIKSSYLSRKLRMSSAKLQRVFNTCSTRGKLSFNYSKERWSFDIPKILELKDNYIKDLQAACNKPSHHKEVEEEVEEEKEKEHEHKKKKTSRKNNFKPKARNILSFLNEKACRYFPMSDVNLGFIQARLKEGCSEDDIRSVTAMKIREWGCDEKMSKYLRPATLYCRKNFNQYVGQLDKSTETPITRAKA